MAKATPSGKTARAKRGASAKKAAKAGKTAKTVKAKAAKKTAAKAKTAKTAKTAKRTARKGAAAKRVKKTAKATKRSAPKSLKSPLSKKELETFRQMLLEKRRQLLGDMSGMEAEAFHGNRQEETGDLSNMPVHMADIGTDNYEQEFTLGLLESERHLLKEINQALGRIADGRYGLCMGSGAPIGIPRLRAKPWARYSIEYARRIEQGMVQHPATDYGQTDENKDDLDDEDD